jgi:hypothetical protein
LKNDFAGITAPNSLEYSIGWVANNHGFTWQWLEEFAQTLA